MPRIPNDILTILDATLYVAIRLLGGLYLYRLTLGIIYKRFIKNRLESATKTNTVDNTVVVP